MTLEQEIKLAAKHAYQKAYKEACEKFDKKTEKVYQKAYDKAYEKGYKEACEKTEMKGVKEKLESARKMKSKNISDDVIAECLGLSLEQVQAL